MGGKKQNKKTNFRIQKIELKVFCGYLLFFLFFLFFPFFGLFLQVLYQTGSLRFIYKSKTENIVLFSVHFF